jgi:tetratricopeptide (TPR) repeat protein
VALALLGGTVATAWQAREARAAQARAERRFADVRRLANSVLFDYHDAIKDLRGARPVRERLVRDALGYLDTLAQEAHDDPSLQRELAVAYKRWGDLQGGEPSEVGDNDGAARSYTRALEMLDALLQSDDTNSQVRGDAASAELALGHIVWDRGDLTAALRHAERARALLEPLVAAAPDDTGLRLQLSSALDRLGEISLEAGDIPGSLAYHRLALQRLESAPAADRRRAPVRMQTSVAYGHLADAQSEAADLAGALESQRRSFALRAELAKEFPENETYANEMGTARYYLAATLGKLNRWEEALALHRENLAQNSTGSFIICRIGEALDHLGRHDEALDHFQRALARHYTELRADTAVLTSKLAIVEDQARICKTLASLGRSDAGGACGQATRSAGAITVDSGYAFPRAFVAAAFTNVGEAYEIQAQRRGTAPAERGGYHAAALDVYQRSRAIWDDLALRKLVSPVDTGRVSSAKRAVARAERLVGATE